MITNQKGAAAKVLRRSFFIGRKGQTEALNKYTSDKYGETGKRKIDYIGIYRACFKRYNKRENSVQL